MPSFPGFSDPNTQTVPVPSSFFTRLMPEVDRLAELKVTLYFFWNLSRQEGDFRYLAFEDFSSDKTLMEGLGDNPSDALVTALKSAVNRGTILTVPISENTTGKGIYFLNTPRGQTALQAYMDGQWSPDTRSHAPVTLAAERPNIFRLYEENIGPLTPIITDNLRAAEDDYSPEWIEDAIRIAVEKNVRNWRYIDAILRTWQEKGRNEINRRNQEENRRRYIEGDYADLIQH